MLLVQNPDEFFHLQVLLKAIAIVFFKGLQTLVYFIQTVHVVSQTSLETTKVLHVAQTDGAFAQSKDIVCIEVLILVRHIDVYLSISLVLLIFHYLLQRMLMHVEHFLDGEHTREPRTFQSLHKQDAHHLHKETLTVHIIFPVALGSLLGFLL